MLWPTYGAIIEEDTTFGYFMKNGVTADVLNKMLEDILVSCTL
jgi:hypothetical protein